MHIKSETSLNYAKIKIVCSFRRAAQDPSIDESSMMIEHRDRGAPKTDCVRSNLNLARSLHKTKHQP